LRSDDSAWLPSDPEARHEPLDVSTGLAKLAGDRGHVPAMLAEELDETSVELLILRREPRDGDIRSSRLRSRGLYQGEWEVLWADGDRSALVLPGQVHGCKKDAPELSNVQGPGMEEEEPERVHLEANLLQPIGQLEQNAPDQEP